MKPKKSHKLLLNAVLLLIVFCVILKLVSIAGFFIAAYAVLHFAPKISKW